MHRFTHKQEIHRIRIRTRTEEACSLTQRLKHTSGNPVPPTSVPFSPPAFCTSTFSGCLTEASSKSIVTVRTENETAALVLALVLESLSFSFSLSTKSCSWLVRSPRISFRRFLASARFRPRCFPGLLVDSGRRAYIAVGIYRNRRSMVGWLRPSSSSSSPAFALLVAQSLRRFSLQSSLLFPSASTTRSVSSNRSSNTGSGPLQGLARLDSSSASRVCSCSSSHRVSTRAFMSQFTARGRVLSPSVKDDRINPLSSHAVDDSDDDFESEVFSVAAASSDMAWVVADAAEAIEKDIDGLV
mmetsp:Transcript_17624/g.48743  ORF Transcript_17624/g.48743 Transcript_17624/m.48743 type:complete len:300 (+) Transcript_17624:1688-2587(+)